tara:strand:- start:587 stop:1252 length:666 start_codon:yes stop_codon:yes gene_type:complete
VISNNLLAIQNKISLALENSGRSTDSCTLVGVSKTKPLSLMKEAFSSGLKDFGENYVEEFNSKYKEYKPEGFNYHFIGKLPTKKVRKIVGNVKLIHSVSSLKLAKKIDFVSQEEGIVQNILLQINQGGESSKSGFENDISVYFDELLNLSNIKILGLMSIPPFSEPARPFFVSLRELRDNLESQFSIKLPYLSMGMSGDFEEAIIEGSTHVRIGTSIFGSR